MEIDLVGESIKFMALGMIVVFLFLAILVELMKLQAKLIAKYFPEEEPEVPARSQGAPAADEASRTAAIVAAIAEFKKNKS
jgi:oxaloacetate decarboxylase gamma subunit